MRRVLIIEDVNSISKLLRNHLEMDGYIVDISNDYFDAYMKTTKKRYDFFFIDIRLNNCEKNTGISVCKNIKERKNTNIMYAITGYDINEIFPECRAVGFDDFFPKPLNLSTIKSVMKMDILKLERWESII